MRSCGHPASGAFPGWPGLMCCRARSPGPELAQPSRSSPAARFPMATAAPIPRAPFPPAAVAHDCRSGWLAVPGQEHQSRDRDRGRAAEVGTRSRVQFFKFRARCGTAGGQAKDQPRNRPRAPRTAATWKPRPGSGQVVERTSQVYRDPGIPVRLVQRPPVDLVTLHPRSVTVRGGITPPPAFLPRSPSPAGPRGSRSVSRPYW
jgi:hypothetical protein